MKLFRTFRLDTANHLLWRNGDRVPIAPKGFDVLAYLVEHAGRVVTQDEMLEALWPETYVNPEVLRKYILEIRKALGDRPGNPEFIETVPKRGYRFIAPVMDESVAEPRDEPTSHGPEEHATEEDDRPTAAPSEQEGSFVKRRLWKLAIIPILAVVAVAGLGGYLLLARSGRNAPSLTNTSIAVMPFADMSPARDQEYFSDGLTEQLIDDLAKVSGLKVIGRASAFQFKGKSEDVRDVGRTLCVVNVLEGSVRREGNHVRITAELIKADDGFQLWSETYDREIEDIFAVQDEIALAATQALQVKLLAGNGQPVAPNLRSANPEAYQAYLQAKYFSERGPSKKDFGKALTYADTAIKLDEEYAPALALRASVQNMMAESGLIDSPEGFRTARDDAERAIALDPTLASAYLALAATQISRDWDWDAANISITKAAALEPGGVEVLRMRSYLSRILGNLDQAIQLYQQAVALDPLRVNSYSGLGYLLYAAGRYQEAQAALQKALDLNPQATYVHLTLDKILIAEGKPEQALVEIEKEPIEWGKFTGQPLAYHALGREQDSNAALAPLIAKYHTTAPYQIAQVYAYRGEADKSFEWLERAYEQRDPGLPEIKSNPLFKNLLHDPRYSDLLSKMHLPT
ncbi:MAG TPA: winged helix-turn-helix domain-containing protein [Edaphobacter sp.]|nr:winged helix-turn-helix domain-containing protein [Edaphobacter sp.]